MSTREAVVAATEGLHARPAATFVQAAKKCGVPVQISMGDKGPVPATSMLSVLGLGAHCGDTVVLSAEDPRVYVITVDGDFDALLADPLLNGVSYALLASPDTAPADAVAERYPGMWEDGAGRAEMARQWSDGRGLTWRLYRFTG